MKDETEKEGGKERQEERRKENSNKTSETNGTKTREEKKTCLGSLLRAHRVTTSYPGSPVVFRSVVEGTEKVG